MREIFQAGRDSGQSENSVNVPNFTPETVHNLEKAGYWIGELTGESIATLRAAGKPIQSDWHKDFPDFEAKRSRKSQVAFRPDQLFLPESHYRTFDECQRLIESFDKKLERQAFGNAEAIMGEAPDWVELAFKYSQLPSIRLFGSRYHFGFTRTATVIEGELGEMQTYVGNFDEEKGLYIGMCTMSFCSHPDMAAAPLIVPK